MGAELRAGNPNVADLSDPNRPTKIAEAFKELYDNEWTNAFEEMQKNKNLKEPDMIQNLLAVLQVGYTAFDKTKVNKFTSKRLHIKLKKKNKSTFQSSGYMIPSLKGDCSKNTFLKF